MKIIDGRVRLRTETLLKMWDRTLHPEVSETIEKYGMAERLKAMSVNQLIDEAQAKHIDSMLVYGMNPDENEHIFDLAAQHNTIIPVGGINLSQGIRHACEEVSKLNSRGSSAVNIDISDGRAVNCRDLYPIYAQCEILGLSVIVHSAIHYSRQTYMWNAQPQYFDEVAVDFPQLKIIMSHGGNGFGPTALAVAQRHPYVYLEFSALRPKYMAPEFIQAANTYLKDRCIFGTDYPLTDFGRQVELWKYALREEVWEGFFGMNLLSALGSASKSARED